MHPSIRPYLEYFSLPRVRAAGAAWSHDGEALETDDATWRFSRQVADFLDGFAVRPPGPALRPRPRVPPAARPVPAGVLPGPGAVQARGPRFRRLNNPARNAGALFAHLCAAVPPAAHVPPGGGKSLAHWLTHSPSLGFLYPTGPGNPEVPGLGGPRLPRAGGRPPAEP